jgi:NADPH2:quinone reductase
MHAASLNRGEFLLGPRPARQAAGSWKAIGGEGAGEVVAVGAGGHGFAPGDRVMGRCAGAFAEYALMEDIEAMAVPAEPVVGTGCQHSADLPRLYDMLVLQGRLRAGEWLLINGVSSGVGVASLQLGKALGAKVIGTSGSPTSWPR